MIDPTVAAGTAGAIVAKGASSAIESSTKKSDQLHAALLEEMKSTSGFKAAAKHKANRLEMKEGLFNWLLRPLFWLNERQSEYYTENFADDMAAKLAHVDVENVVPPEPNIGIQAMEGLAYSLDSPELKDMYLELLATASDKVHQSEAHPSFASIIRQLSPREAVRLPDFLQVEPFGTVANVMLTAKHGGQRYLESHVPSLYDDVTNEMIVEPNMASMIDNWTRLGQVNVKYKSWSPDADAYAYMETRPEYLKWKSHYSANPDVRVTIQPGIIHPTDFGRLFKRAVLR
ncbi:DUF4393 domain-containing protein [Brevibacterium casei]|uniref:DUF4393 domain-containing protein n=1 Tax=Brevibacterium casei TaxID=33889 RepID=UPI00344D144D